MVYNQGSDTVQDIQVREFFAEGFAYDQATNGPNGWSDSEPIPFATITGPIAPGDSASIPIILELSPMMFDGRAWDNYDTIDSAFTTSGVALLDDADSSPGTNSASENAVLPNSPDDNNIFGGGPTAGEDEDDHDVASIPIIDFALTKIRVTSPASYSYNQAVTFQNNIYNQGNQEADTIFIVDYIPCGFEFVQFVNPDWTYDSINRIARYALTPAPLPATDVGVSLTLLVNPCYDDPETA